MVHISHTNAHALQIGGQILRHTLGQRCDQHALLPLNPLVDLADQVVNLPLNRAHKYLRIDQTGRTNDLLDDLRRAAGFKFRRCGADVDCLMNALLKFLKIQRAVVIGGRQAEAVVHEALFARRIAVVHRAHLRQRDVRLVYDQQKIIREIVDQRERCTARLSAGYHAGIVLDSAAKADFLHHFDVIPCTLLDALRLDQLVIFLEPFDALLQLSLNLANRRVHLFLGRDVVRCRIDCHMLQIALACAGQRVNLADAVDFISKKLHAHRVGIRINRPDLHRITTHAEAVSLKCDVIALILNVNQLAGQLIAILSHALP